MGFEHRSFRSFELTEEGAIAGRAIVFGQPSVDFGDWYEVIEGPVRLSGDLILDHDHRSDHILARTSNGTLSVTEGPDAVDFVGRPPDTTWVADLKEEMRGGYVSGCSFAFECLDDEWGRDATGKVFRKVKDAVVHALTVTGLPAYPQTTSEVRNRAAEMMEPAISDPDGTIDEDPHGGDDAHGAKDIASKTCGLVKVAPRKEDEDD